jgi:hypothetical protein
MNSFREKFGLRLADTSDTVTSWTKNANHFNIELSISRDDSSNGSITYLDGPKKRADTAETEMSFQPPSSKDSIQDDNYKINLKGIGSYDDDECMIWYADPSLSLSNDCDENEQPNKLSSSQPALAPLDTESVFAEANTMFAFHTKPSNAVCPNKPKKCNKKNDNSKSNARGFFSSGILLPVSTRKSDFFSRNGGSSNAAKCRKFFSLSKVPASIAEEPCSTPSSTSASAPSSP